MAGGRWMYVRHPAYAQDPDRFVRAFLLLQKDFEVLTESIDLADQNLSTFSFRVHELLVRSCIEIEANFHAIFFENNHKGKRWVMSDYVDIEHTHHLSGYTIRIPYWRGAGSERVPFKVWQGANPVKLPWYEAYNSSKHSRHSDFSNATFEHLVDAIAALCIVLSAQFLGEEFRPSDDSITFVGNPLDNFESAIGGFFRVRYPRDWPQDKIYDFEWEKIKDQKNPFQKLW